MGARFSRFIDAYRTAQGVSQKLTELLEKFSLPPGLPVPNPTTPYWAHPPSPIAKHGADDPLLEYADVVIIGSGITGTAIARTLLDSYHPTADNPLTVVMLEARDTCSGATARNGGHITPWLYHDYLDLKRSYGATMAQKIIRFRLSHIENLLQVAEEEDILADSQCRRVETYDVFFDKGLFEDSKNKLSAYSADLPKESRPYRIIEDREEIKRMQLSPLVMGCIATTAGAVHPYRLVTGVLSRLLCQYSMHFHLFTSTPCVSIQQPTVIHAQHSQTQGPYIVKTSRGDIRARHVVHATNGWASQLLPGMRRKIVPARGDMTAQRPGQALGKYLSAETGDEQDWTGGRSFVFYSSEQQTRYDYLTQQPLPVTKAGGSGAQLPCAGELMFGGGFLQGGSQANAFFETVGNSDDSTWSFGIAGYLSGALGLYFEPGWGKEQSDETKDVDGAWGQGRIKAHWSGILGFSVDDQPWVGRVPVKICGRNPGGKHPSAQASDICDELADDMISILTTTTTEKVKMPFESASSLVADGEWISAGYTGEGMPHAWMCGTALAHMLLGTDKVPALLPTPSTSCRGAIDADAKGGPVLEDAMAGRVPGSRIPAWLPEVFLITEERWKRADVGKWLASV